MHANILFLIAALAATPLAAAAEIHQWRDAEGQLHFGDRAPADTASTVVKVRTNVYTSPSIEALSKSISRSEQVVMYSAAWCGYCKKARNYFKREGIAFTEYDIETSAQGQRDYERLGARGVPVILVGERRLNGFSEASFRKIYKTK